MAHKDWFTRLKAAQARVDALLAEEQARCEPFRQAFLAGTLSYDEYTAGADQRVAEFQARLAEIHLV